MGQLKGFDVSNQASESALAKTLTLPQAIGLAITMVVGSGLLALPGLAYQEAGAAAIYAWIISTLVTAPFLVIFANLGARLPGAGGIAGFIQSAYSRRASIPTEFLLLGTFVVGGPAMVITGGHYFAAAFGMSASGVIIGGLLVLLFAGTINYLGARISGRVQQILAIVLVLMLAAIAIVALLFGTKQGTGIAPVSEWASAIPSIGLVFFAFVGWEMMSFTTEEFRNPRRDFPITLAISFVIVAVLYTLIAAAVQVVLPLADESLVSAPIAALLGSTFGATSQQVVAFIGLILILANFTSGMWAASRLVFSSAREGLLPAALSRVDARTQTPRAAIIAMFLSFVPILLVYLAGGVSQGLLFQLAGVNFFTLYALSVIAYIKLAENRRARIFGLLAMALVVAVMYSFGSLLLFPLVLLGAGYAWGYVDGMRKARLAQANPRQESAA
jgi:amino acid efflux transporter